MGLVYEGTRVKLYEGTFNRGTKGHQLHYKGEDGKQKRKSAPKNMDAIAWAKEMDHRLAAGELTTFASVEKLQFADYLPYYISELEERLKNHREDSEYGRKISSGTMKKAMVHINKHIKPFFRKYTLGEIKPSTMLRFQEHLQKQMKPQTANQVFNCMGRILSFFVTREYLDINPAREVDPLPETPSDQGYTPNIKEVRKVIVHAREQWHSVLIKLCAETGVRVSEALGLEWTNIRNDIIYVKQSAVRQEIGPTKTRNGKRKVQITTEMMLALKEMRLKSDSKFVFVNKEGRLLTSSCALRQALEPACNLAGVTRFTFHGLRRFYINTLLDQGKRLDHVQKLVGHSIGSKVTDKHYRDIKDEDVLNDNYLIAI